MCSSDLIKVKKLLDEVECFRNSRAVVRKIRQKPNPTSKFNYITMEGEILSNLWFDKAEPFSKNFALVIQEPHRYNFLRLDGSLVFKTWLDAAKSFEGEYAVIKQHGSSTYQLMNSSGEVLKDRYDSILISTPDKIIVQKKGKFNILNQNLEMMMSRWPTFIRYIYPFSNELALVEEHSNTYNYLGGDGSWLFQNELGQRKSLALEMADSFCEGFAVVEDYFPHRGKVANFIDSKGKFLSKKWFDSASSFSGGLAAVYNQSSQWNYIDLNGKLLYPDGFASIDVHSFCDGLALVFLKDQPEKPRFIKKSGEFLDHPELSGAKHFIDGRALVEIDGEYSNFLTIDGTFLIPEHHKIGFLDENLRYVKGNPQPEDLFHWTDYGNLNWFGEILD